MALQFFNSGSSTAGYYSTTTPPITSFPHTMSCWFNRRSTPGQGFLMSIGTATLNKRCGMEVNNSGASVVLRGYTAGASDFDWEDSGAVPAQDTWAHGAHIIRSATDRSTYLNNVRTDGSFNVGSTLTFTQFSIGYDIVNGAANFTGRIAEIGIWNTALDDAEIKALAAGASPIMVRPASLKFYAPLLGPVSQSPIDWMGTAGSFTQTGGVPEAYPHPPVWRPRPGILHPKPTAAVGVARHRGFFAA